MQLINHGIGSNKKGTFSMLFLFYIQEIHVGGPVKHKLKMSGLRADMNVSEKCSIAASKGNQINGLITRNITYKEKS